MLKTIRIKNVGEIDVWVDRIFSNDHVIKYGSFKRRYFYYTLQEAIRLFKIEFINKRNNN